MSQEKHVYDTPRNCDDGVVLEQERLSVHNNVTVAAQIQGRTFKIEIFPRVRSIYMPIYFIASINGQYNRRYKFKVQR